MFTSVNFRYLHKRVRWTKIEEKQHPLFYGRSVFPLLSCRVADSFGFIALGDYSPMLFAVSELFRFHSQIVHDEGEDVGLFVHDLGYRLACAMSCVGVDTDKFRFVSRIGPLQLGGIFE